MFYKVKEVKALPNLKLWVRFMCGVIKVYDVRPLIQEIKAFQALKERPGLFEKVQVDMGASMVLFGTNNLTLPATNCGTKV